MNPPPIPLSEILSADEVEIVGDLDPATSFRWIERNSRVVQPGDLFIAVIGEVHDGHAFLADAISHGATAALVARHKLPDLEANIPLLVSDDPVTALQRIAANRRQQLNLHLTGVTGSIGKTTTKEVIAAVLATKYRTFRNPGNMNSEIGLPLSLLEVQPGTEQVVLEMGGAYAFGELALLASIARPSTVAVTNIHPVHLERMGSIEAIAETKAELVDALPDDGLLILNGDDHRVRAMADRTKARVVMVGREPGNDFRATDIEILGFEGARFNLHGLGESRKVAVPLLGDHGVETALIGFAIAAANGIPVDQAIEGMHDPSLRVRLLQLPGPNNSILIDDTYNAAAPSVLSALNLLDRTPATRKVAVLGDMRELGAESERQHRVVGERVGQVADLLITFGESARIIADQAGQSAAVDGRSLEVQSFAVDQREALTRHLLTNIRTGDAVLLKGSRGLEMETIVADLTVAAEASTPQG